MCGIVGMVDWRAATSLDALQTIGVSMNETLRHRGPDGGDVWAEAAGGVVLGQRRLAIIDLSVGGKQPMHSANGRFVIVFNGEIYNYRDIREELAVAGRRMKSDSDTEVLLEACALWGVEEAVQRTIGMFAFALWDRERKTLSLVRDRLGIKPMYYAATNSRVMFASELKAFRKAPDWKPSIDPDAVVGYLRHAYIGQPKTIYREAAKLPPGHILTFQAGTEPKLACFWDLRRVVTSGLTRNEPPPDEHEAVDRLDALLRDAVRLRMIADVPLGAFLSGGIDSSTVVALMQAQSTQAVKTFSIGFHESGYDEAKAAKEVARHLGTDHTEFYLEPKHALDIIPRLPDWYDEPFADSSQIPTYLVSEMTRKHVTVALSGDGGDELFAGYNRYFWAERILRNLNRVPGPLRGPLRAALQAVPTSAWDRILSIAPQALRQAQPGDKLHKLAALLDNPSPDAIYLRLVSQWAQPGDIAARGEEPMSVLRDPSVANDLPGFVPRMQYMDMASYLPDDILTKVDRATMAVGLEGRVPLIDHRVVAYAWTLPMSLKVRDGQGKWVLRQVLDRYVPKRLIDRPKQGFGVPIDSWLRGPLRDWAENLLDPKRLAEGGLFRPEPIRKVWSEHLAGTRNWQYPLWTVLMFEAWRQRWA
jgi:asparagine synthase (glutamine-hydrolysing)